MPAVHCESYVKLTSSVDAEGHGQWFGAAATQELRIGWPWQHEYVSLAQITHLAASTTIHICSTE